MWDEKTVEAIKESVEHWEDNVEKLEKGETSTVKFHSRYNCALCNKFNSTNDEDCKSTCPLSLKGFYCGDSKSPYKTYVKNETIRNAQNVVLVLKSLFYPEPEKPEKKEVFYHIGQEFKRDENEWLLSRIDYNGVTLIMIKGYDKGNRFKFPINVKDSRKITEKEFQKLCGSGTFTLKSDSK